MLLVQSCLKMDPWRSFWERLWAASPCEFLRDSKSTNGDHGGESMRHLSHWTIPYAYSDPSVHIVGEVGDIVIANCTAHLTSGSLRQYHTKHSRSPHMLSTNTCFGLNAPHAFILAHQYSEKQKRRIESEPPISDALPDAVTGNTNSYHSQHLSIAGMWRRRGEKDITSIQTKQLAPGNCLVLGPNRGRPISSISMVLSQEGPFDAFHAFRSPTSDCFPCPTIQKRRSTS